jgi:hypothetical protein
MGVERVVCGGERRVFIWLKKTKSRRAAAWRQGGQGDPMNQRDFHREDGFNIQTTLTVLNRM